MLWILGAVAALGLLLWVLRADDSPGEADALPEHRAGPDGARWRNEKPRREAERVRNFSASQHPLNPTKSVNRPCGTIDLVQAEPGKISVYLDGLRVGTALADPLPPEATQAEARPGGHEPPRPH